MKKTWIVLTMVLAVLLIGGLFFAPKVNAEAFVTSEQYIAILKEREGFSKYPYWDNGHWSIGYGNTCPDSMYEYYKENGITLEEAEVMLRSSLVGFEATINKFATKHNLTLTQNQFDALISFTYNCGSAWTRSLDGYFNTAVRSGDTGSAFLYGISLYGRTGNNYVLMKRRMLEANIYINGNYNGYPDNYRWVFLDPGVGQVRYKVFGYDTELEPEINVAFERLPVGIDAEGNPFVYEPEGWYTADGRRIDRLDDTLNRGDTLFIKWKNPITGQVEEPPVQKKPEEVFPRTGKIVNCEVDVNVRTGPGTSYDKNGLRAKDETVTILEAVSGSAYTVNGKTHSTWGKLSDNEWIALGYVQYDDAAVTQVELVKGPDLTEYSQPILNPWLEGSILLIKYSNGDYEAKTVTVGMTSGFDGSKTGVQTLTATYKGFSVTFDVTVKPRVPDQMTSEVYKIADGTVTGIPQGTTAEQLLGAIAEQKFVELRKADGTPAEADGVLATGMQLVLLDGEVVKQTVTVIIRGDVTGDGVIDGMDATALLQYSAGWEITLNPAAADVNGDGNADGMDATALLQYAAGWEITIVN
ncbi:MAG: glycoside hydrolase family protein [Oscillospiraceae bacterium]|nr:glycoside hydrolase family protein [Oscillospiraceae bacterium]